VKPGLIEVFAYQETLLIMAVFGIAILAMAWFGFRRWLQSKEKMDRLLSEQAAEQTAQFGAHMERVEARLNTIEQIVSDGGFQTAPQIEKSARPAANPIASPDPTRANR
jgi:hypothetical protein